MATKPKAIDTSKINSPEVLNAIIHDSSDALKSAISASSADGTPYIDTKAVNSVNPVIRQSAVDKLRTIGHIVLDFEPYRNEFLPSLYNRIIATIVTSKMYQNPWGMWKRGMLDNGESIEEIYVNIAKGHKYRVTGTSKLYSLERPDVRSQFHYVNFKAYYKQSIFNKELKQAFLSFEGVDDLIARIVQQMYSSSNTDEFLCMKYLLAKAILNGYMKTVDIPNPNSESNTKDVVKKMLSMSDKLTFNKKDFNYSGVYNYTLKENQYVIVNADYSAEFNVDVLAYAFNEDRVNIQGRRVLVDSFADLDQDRLVEIVEDYEYIDNDILEQLDKIPFVIVDENFFQIYDTLNDFAENFNGEELYWNYWLHHWQILSFSGFSNALAFVPNEVVVNSVEVDGADNVTSGQKSQYSATVSITGLGANSVTWSVSENEIGATISHDGVLNTVKGKTGTIDVIATSTQDSSVTGSKTVTIN